MKRKREGKMHKLEGVKRSRTFGGRLQPEGEREKTNLLEML